MMRNKSLWQIAHLKPLLATSLITQAGQLTLAGSFMLGLLSLAGCDALKSAISIPSSLDSDKSAVETYINNEYQGQDPKILKWHAKTPIKRATFVRPNGEKYHMTFDTREEAVEMVKERERVTGERVTLEVYETVGMTISVEFQFTKDGHPFFQYSKLHVVDGKVVGSSMAVTVGNDYDRLSEAVKKSERELTEFMRDE